MKNIFYLLLILTISNNAFAQEEKSEEEKEDESLKVFGSVDIYWKYDFSGYTDSDGTSNIKTSFADKFILCIGVKTGFQGEQNDNLFPRLFVYIVVALISGEGG